jgi:transposase
MITSHFVKYFVNKNSTFLDIFLFLFDNESMEGLTIDEMAEILGIPRHTIEVRINRAGIDPLTKSAVYDKSVLEIIRNVPGKGRPRKKTGNDIDKNA